MVARTAVSLFLAASMVLCLASCGGSGSTPPPSFYSIGGTVSGLSGTGLVLQDNGGNNLPVSANGTFTFTATVASGGSYKVTVLTQPANPLQSCTVANASGTATGNVSSVQIACSTTTYTVGGTVSGLAGTGLILQDNGSDNLPVGANGPFTFSTSVASGGAYAVQVISQPLNPAQNCVIANGTGNANANVTNVQVSCTTLPLYTIGGTLSGLSSNTNLLLLDNGTDQLVVSVNGIFTFNTQLPAGSTYNVTISRQPFDENCTVKNGSATANSNVTTVQVNCASKLKELYHFGAAPDGNNPNSRLVFDSAGNLYGVTLQGGTVGAGIVFKLSPTSSGPWTETVLHNFCSKTNCADGGAPHGNLVFDAAGNLYGTTSSGGAHQGGVVFEMSPQSNGTWTYAVLHSFGNGTDGNQPFGGVILDTAGNLYGTTAGGGTTTTFCAGGCGIAYELSPGSGSWTETVLYNFCSQTSCTDGNGPVGELVFDNAGNLYGATTNGGDGGAGGPPAAGGTAFQLTPGVGGPWTHSVLLTFIVNGGSIDGYEPNGGFSFVHSSSSPVILWGTTSFGGTGNAGMLFSLSPPGGGGLPWLENPVDNFCNACGSAGPNPGLLITSSSIIYGTSSLGGTPGAGVIFQIGGVVYTFQGTTDGLNPPAGVIADTAGNLYGVAEGGDPNGPTGGYGMVFEVTP